MQVGNEDVPLPTTGANYPNPRRCDGRAFAVRLKGGLVHDAISREALEDAVLGIVRTSATCWHWWIASLARRRRDDRRDDPSMPGRRGG